MHSSFCITSIISNLGHLYHNTPANFDALLRHHTIDKCLQNCFRNWTWQNLAEKCIEAILEANSRPNKNTISQRTIENDIGVMRSDILGYNAPIVRKQGFYYYKDKEFQKKHHDNQPGY